MFKFFRLVVVGYNVIIYSLDMIIVFVICFFGVFVLFIIFKIYISCNIEDCLVLSYYIFYFYVFILKKVFLMVFYLLF